MPAGRPTEYDADLAYQICEEIAQGSNLNKLCLNEKFPTRPTIYNWFHAQPSFADDYARARETRADWRADKVDSVIEDLRNGLIDYNVARIEIDAIKWQAGKEKPKVYGDKIQTEHSGTITMNPGDAIRAKRLARIAGEK